MTIVMGGFASEEVGEGVVARMLDERVILELAAEINFEFADENDELHRIEFHSR